MEPVLILLDSVRPTGQMAILSQIPTCVPPTHTYIYATCTCTLFQCTLCTISIYMHLVSVHASFTASLHHSLFKIVSKRLVIILRYFKILGHTFCKWPCLTPLVTIIVHVGLRRIEQGMD